MRPTTGYTAIISSSDDEITSEGDEKAIILEPVEHVAWYSSKKFKLLSVLLVGINVALSVFSAVSLYKARQLWTRQKNDGSGDYRRPGLNADLKSTSAYSPILDALDFKPALRTLNGRLSDNSSIWRQPPSKEVDSAWDYISAKGLEVITVSSEALQKSGKDPVKCVKAPPSWGEGTDAYVAQVDVFHQIHCLDELRKEIYYHHYYKSPPDELHRAQKSHCIHILLENIMCTADVGVVSHNWVHNEHTSEPKTRPMPDFDLVKKCNDFDTILDWARENSVKDLPEKWHQLKYTPGVEEVIPGDANGFA